MVIKEYGEKNERVILLLHGGGLSWWNYRDVISMLVDHYHVIVPILDGHAGSDKDFTSIEENARDLCRYVRQRYAQGIFAIGGLSLGGQILVEMLSTDPDLCKYAIIESALVMPMKLTNLLIPSAVSLSYGLIKERWFATYQFKELRMKEALFEDYYTDTCKVSKQNMIAFLQANSSYHLKNEIAKTTANVTIVVGAKERNIMLKSADLLHKSIEGSTMIVKPYYHGELSINHASEYVDLLLRE